MSSKTENIIIIDGEEKYNKTFMPSLVCSKFEPAKVSLLCFYIELQAEKRLLNINIKSNQMAEILEIFYGFKKLGSMSIETASKHAQLNYDPWKQTINIPHYTVLDLQDNWNRYAKISGVIDSINIFHKNGLDKYLAGLSQLKETSVIYLERKKLSTV